MAIVAQITLVRRSRTFIALSVVCGLLALIAVMSLRSSAGAAVRPVVARQVVASSSLHVTQGETLTSIARHGAIAEVSAAQTIDTKSTGVISAQFATLVASIIGLALLIGGLMFVVVGRRHNV